MRSVITAYLEKASDAVEGLREITADIEHAAEILKKSLDSGGRVLVLGCGGSAADAQHFATELQCRFRKDRSPLPALALTTNTSLLTAVSNDYDFSHVFSRQVRALAADDDAVVLISTSGNSDPVLKAAAAAGEVGAKTVGLTGSSGGLLKDLCDVMVAVPSDITSHIQEAHITVIHIICLLLENSFFPDE